MNYSQAKATARAMVFETRIDHVISFDGVSYSVHMAPRYKGNITETIKFKYIKKKTDAVQPKKGKRRAV